MNIRITKIPPGEAPEEIRAAWVGLVLPLAIDGPQVTETWGVLSRPKTEIDFFSRLFGKIRQEEGYIVDAHRAVEILAEHAPEAAQWWRENAASCLEPDQGFLFAPDGCEEVEE